MVTDEPLWYDERVVALVYELMGAVVLFQVFEDGLALEAYRFDLLGLRNAQLQELERTAAVVLGLEATELP